METPAPLMKPKFKRLIELCVEHTEDVAENGYIESDIHAEVFELAMEIIYGRDYFKWYNRKMDEA